MAIVVKQVPDCTVQVNRISKGSPVKKELVVVLSDSGKGFPMLAISTDGRKCDNYGVEEIPSPLGRAFLLHRTPEAIAKDTARNDGSEPDAYYGVLLANEQDRQCQCRGFQSHGHCKHVDALQHLLANGELDLVMNRRHVEPQTIAEMIEAPF